MIREDENEDQKQHIVNKPMKKQTREKYSVGIACIRIVNKIPEILLICKRYTYGYNMFVHGRYNSGDTGKIIAMFNGMTVEEKHDILSLNFSQIWYRIWLNSKHRLGAYFAAKNKFESTFAVDGGLRLRRMIIKSTNSSKIWEIPKGHRARNETNIDCAIREFKEETGISKKHYHIFPATRKQVYIDAGTKYTNTFYFAYTAEIVEPKIDFGSVDQVCEVSDIRWLSVEQIRLLDATGRLARQVRPIMHYVKRKLSL